MRSSRTAAYQCNVHEDMTRHGELKWTYLTADCLHDRRHAVVGACPREGNHLARLVGGKSPSQDLTFGNDTIFSGYNDRVLLRTKTKAEFEAWRGMVYVHEIVLDARQKQANILSAKHSHELTGARNDLQETPSRTGRLVYPR